MLRFIADSITRKIYEAGSLLTLPVSETVPTYSPNILAKNTAICARVTCFDGQYIRGFFLHPVVIPSL